MTVDPAIELGRGVHGGAVAPDAVARVPLAMMNRLGLVAGATGTGKTKTLQVIASGPQGVGDFLRSREGKQLQREVMRGVFGMSRKRL